MNLKPQERSEFLEVIRSFARREAWCGRPPTMDQLKALGTYFSAAFKLDRDTRLAVIGDVVGRSIVSTHQLTRGEANALLAAANSPHLGAKFQACLTDLIAQRQSGDLPHVHALRHGRQTEASP